MLFRSSASALSRTESWDSAAHGFRIICFITSANAADYQQVPCLERAEADLFRDGLEDTGARDGARLQSIGSHPGP